MNIDWSALWELGGHGQYVWPAYLAAAVLAVAEACSLLRRLAQAPAPDLPRGPQKGDE